MHPPSQYQARRLLELVSNNRTRVRRSEHVELDRWARQSPPLRGVVYNSRALAKSALRAGALGAAPAPVPVSAPPPAHSPPQPPDTNIQLKDVRKGAAIAPPAHRTANPMPRAESGNSHMSKISSVPSFGKMREPLSADSARLSSLADHPNLPKDQKDPTLPAPGRRPRLAKPQYEEFGSEALITSMHDDLDDDYEADADPSSRLFREIGPSISMAHGIDKIPRNDPTPPVYEGQIQPPMVTVDMAPQTDGPTNPLEQSYEYDARLDSQNQQLLVGTPPPPPYHPGAAPLDGPVPPPPSSPPPKASTSDDLARLRINPGYAKDLSQDVEDSSPVTEAFEQFEGGVGHGHEDDDQDSEEDVPDSDEEYPASLENGRIEEVEQDGQAPYEAKVSSYGKDAGVFRRADRDDLPGRGVGTFAGRRMGSGLSGSEYLSRSEYTAYSEDIGSTSSFARSVEDDVLEEDESIGRDYHDVDALSDVAAGLHYSNSATAIPNLT